MDTKHTPGPWTVTHDHMHHTYVWRSGDELPDSMKISIAQVHYNREANARLIAAAPDLLAALEAMVNMEDWSQEDIDPQSTVGRAYAAIAAAKGEA